MPHPIPTRPSCFGERLLRREANRWHWCDGVAEPRVHEIATALWNIPERPFDGRIEVPLAQAQAYDPLRWVVTGCSTGEFETDVSSIFGGASRSDDGAVTTAGMVVALIPVATWKTWRALCPCVPLWNSAAEIALIARARELGWDD